nr:alpha PnIB=mollusc-specific alpha-conotoxin [Conus pennaceus=snails, venom, Peptide, 16 aa] [Conus pennaceus]
GCCSLPPCALSNPDYC